MSFLPFFLAANQTFLFFFFIHHGHLKQTYPYLFTWQSYLVWRTLSCLSKGITTRKKTAISFSLKTAVAASLGLRSYLYLEHTDDNIIRINLPDIGVERVWKLEELPLGVDYPDSGTHIQEKKKK